MRIGIYNPYLHSLSGGERYTLTLASHWSRVHRVELFWDDPSIIAQAQSRFSLNLSFVTVVPNIFRSNIFVKLFGTKQYDVIVILSDGSIPWTYAKHNILHFQMPFSRIKTSSLKSSRYDVVVCNSEFTKRNIDSKLFKKLSVIYPPINLVSIKSQRKQKIILSVGRFTSIKKQDVLIDAFKNGYANGFYKGWKLLIAGGLLPSDQAYYSYIENKTKWLPIELFPNIEYSKLQNLYGVTAMYWHACGYGEVDPQKTEHFGISTVEAMAYGAVPLVFNGGGQPEIVQHKVNGMIWETPDQLTTMTSALLQSPVDIKEMSHQAQIRAKDFSLDRFTKAFDILLKDITNT